MILRKMMSLLAGLLLSAAVHASPVTWDFTGHIVAVQDGSIPLGTPLEIFLRFDNDAAFLNQNVPGRYVYASNSIGMDVWLDGTFIRTFNFDPAYGGTLFVRNDSLFFDPSLAPVPVPVDGLTFGLKEDDGDGGMVSLQFVMRGTDTSVLGSGQIPTLPPPGLLDLQAHNFQICDSSGNNPGSCDMFQLDVALDSVSAVPEPGTVMLCGIAVLGLARMRRRSGIRS
jgi:hypothetical protein